MTRDPNSHRPSQLRSIAGFTSLIRLRSGWMPFALPLAVGAWLRLTQLSKQMLGDDEWHVLRPALDNGYRYLASHFGLADHNIPLALYCRLMMDYFRLSEPVLRAPIVLIGIALALVFALLVQRMAGRTTAVAFSWLLAASPLLIFYSRFFRAYGPALFLAFTAAIAF